MRKLLLCLLAGIPATWDYAQQCPAILNCPQGTMQFCDLTDNDSTYWNAEPFTWSPTLQSTDVYEGSADLNVKVLGCSGGGPVSISYVLYFDFDNDNLEETIVQSAALPPAGKVLCNNAFNPGYSGGDTLLFDQHTTVDSLRFRFALETETLGDTAYAWVRWNTTSNPNSFITPRLPEGKHRIIWTIVQDGVVRTCQYAFRIKDCLAPLLNCQTGITVTLDTSGTGILDYTSMLLSTEDNITPVNLLDLSIRKANTGLGFPINDAGDPVHQLEYDCDEAGLQAVELWVRDRAGNLNYCATGITVLSDQISCPTPYPECCAQTYWGNGHPIKQVEYDMVWVNPDQSTFSYALPLAPDACGMINFLPPAGMFTIVPKKNWAPLNGISTYDLVLISRHILAVQLFDAPWKIVAADINKNGSVTTTDIIELRKMLLGVIDSFPNNTSWRFFTADCQFPPNPFSAMCLSKLSLQTVPYNFYQVQYLFKGLKVGDVNGSAEPDSVNAGSQDRATYQLLLPDRILLAGETADIPVKISGLSEWSGFQLALQFDAHQLVMENIIPGNIPAMDENVFAQPAPGLLTASWFDALPHWLAPGESLFTIRVKALQTVQLRDALQLNTSRLAPEAYGVGEETRQRLELRFVEDANTISETQVFPPQPNPTSGSSLLALHLTQAEKVHLELCDVSGKQVYSITQFLPQGTTTLELPASAFPQTGIYLWRVQAGNVTESGKVVRM